jgi:hypothetical protein
MSDTWLDSPFAKADALEGVTAAEVGPEIADELGLQSAIEKDTAEPARNLQAVGQAVRHCFR